MCRLFGFRSVISSQVHSSLTNADNALSEQSVKHPHGWGVAYYMDQVPHVIKSPDSAQKCSVFHRVSGLVSSQTVLAHIRKATQGQTSILNSHPFQFGKWTFAHNGNMAGFDTHKDQLLQKVDPRFQGHILGDTDSEVFFKIILTQMQKRIPNLFECREVAPVIEAAKAAIEDIRGVVGSISNHDKPRLDCNYLTFILTDGEIMLGVQAGQPLNYCTYKTRCPERSSCSFFAPLCEAPDPEGKINHLIFSSEVIQGENVWHELQFGEMIGVDHSMSLKKEKLSL